MLAKNSLSSRTARNPRKGSDSSFDAGMILCLSSSDDEIDLVKQKIQDIRVIQEIPEIYISDDSSDDLDILNETTRVNTRSRVPTSLRNPPKHKSHSSLERNRKDDVNLLLSTVMGENKAKAKEISNLKTELAECQQKLDDLLTEGGDEDDPRNTRIKQLSKRNKRLIVAFEKEKTKNSSLQEQIDTFRAATDKKSDLTVGETKLAKLASELKSIKEKNAYSARKLEEERISNQSLRSEVRTLTKVLHQELGDGMQLERILKGETNFKGRAEQISILQDKVKELQRKSQLGSKSSSAHKEIMSTNLSKKKEIETLTLKLQDVQNHLKESKRKVDSLLARIRYQLPFNVEFWRHKTKN